MAKKRYVLVGTGVRAINFIEPIAQRFREDAELVALCDLSPTRMAYYNALLAGKLGSHAVPTYGAEQFEKMIKEQRPDCVIVTSKDSTHHDYIVRALELGCDAITEKPMTVDAEKTRLILDAVAKTGRKVQVAFNYRWSAHRTKVRELIMNGTIGRVTNVNVEYLLNTNHGADYYRRWHATMADSGGLLVHKSTHHFDLVNWWIDAIPEQVFAYGRLDFYGKKNAVARGEAERTKYARYTGEAAAKQDPFALDLREHERLAGLYFDAEAETGYVRDKNVFREEIDIYDNMSVIVRYRTGVQMNYSLVSFSAREGMRVSINGDKGRIEYAEFQPTHILGIDESKREAADKASESIHVYPLFKPSYEVTVKRLEGGHDGSDPVLAEQTFSAHPPEDPFKRKAGHEQGAASILIGIAANQSIATNRPVNLLDLATLNPGAKKLSELV
ncbi:MAG TPA: Gfo/Idh/MocA family oxidoreductase [Opitutaceae bacterium]|nr:Gfo/Idh/MocA family oxidoreductase [Opitutaceae bacterium]